MTNSVQAAQRHGVDVEEVRRQDRLRLGVKEPRQDCPDRRGAGSIPASFRICHTVDDASLCPGPASSTARVGPVPPDEVGVPAQQGPRGDDQAHPAELAARQQPGQRGQRRPVGPRQPRGLDLPLEHGDLVTQDQDLDVPGAIGPGEQAEPAEHPERREVGDS